VETKYPDDKQGHGTANLVFKNIFFQGLSRAVLSLRLVKVRKYFVCGKNYNELWEMYGIMRTIFGHFIPRPMRFTQ
jgi:hypothetical protein